MNRVIAMALLGVCWMSARADSRTAAAAATDQELLSLQGDINTVHDPATIKEGKTYYLFSTGGRAGQGMIPVRTSTDMRTWKAAGFVFDALPEWATREIPQARDVWAPDISFYNGEYHLYYAVSTFGSGNSAIGL